MRISIETFGCTANRADSDEIAAAAKQAGHELCARQADPDTTDVVIVNSCGVKDAAEKKIIHRVRALRAAGMRVVLCGCLPHINESETRKLEELGVDVVGLDRRKLMEILVSAGDVSNAGDVVEGRVQQRQQSGASGAGREFTRPIARIPICSGCLSNCSFCATKLARGSLKSHSPATILGWIEEAVRCGAKEIQLTGQDIGCYGADIDVSLDSLIRSIDKLEGNFRVRVGMANPNYIGRISGAVRQIMSSSRFYHFLHMPVQSGNDSVLKDMRRGYKADDVRGFVADLRREFGDSAVTFWTDIIVGFPTEDEGAFMDSLGFVRDARPDFVNISRFWARPGTEAASLRQLPVAVVKERSARLARACEGIALERNSAHIGRIEIVTILEKGRGKTLKGRNESYNQVVIQPRRGGMGGPKLGDTVIASITAASATGLTGASLKNV